MVAISNGADRKPILHVYDFTTFQLAREAARIIDLTDLSVFTPNFTDPTISTFMYFCHCAAC